MSEINTPGSPASGVGEVTSLLKAYGEGDRGAFDRLVPLVYDDLRRIARGQIRRGGGLTLETTGLVHEAWMKLAEGGRLSLNDREHFFAVSARAMRQVVIALIRRRGATKRGSGEKAVTLDEARLALEDQGEALLALDRALERLASRDERLVRVVECRFFAGLSEEETATALGVSLRSAQRYWMKARAWLKEELSGEARGTP